MQDETRKEGSMRKKLQINQDTLLHLAAGGPNDPKHPDPKAPPEPTQPPGCS
jgi:hypothetical protein